MALKKIGYCVFLEYECRGDARVKELLFLVVHNGWLYIQVVMAVLLYGVLMCCCRV